MAISFSRKSFSIWLFALALSHLAIAQRITITHWQPHHEARTPILREFIDKFQAKYPNVRVEFEPIPFEQYFDKLTVGLATGKGPDVFQIKMDWAEQFIWGGLVAPVPEQVLSLQQAKSRFMAWTVRRLEHQNRLYGLPTDVQHLVLFINNDLAREAGLDPNNPPKTWEELIAQARKATKRDAAGNILQAGLDTRYRWAIYTALLYQYIRGPVIDPVNLRVNYASPEGMQAWRVVEQLIRGPQAVDSPRFLTGQFKFEQNRAVFYINHPVTRGRLERMAPNLRYTVAPLPAPPGKSPVTPGSHWAYVVNARSPNAEWAWRWIAFITSEESQIRWYQGSGELPSARNLAFTNHPALVRTPTDRVIFEALRNVRPTEYVGNADPVRNDLFDAIALTTTPLQTLVQQAAQRELEVVRRALGR